jgi:hypothetical protein
MFVGDIISLVVAKLRLCDKQLIGKMKIFSKNVEKLKPKNYSRVKDQQKRKLKAPYTSETLSQRLFP